MRLESLSNFLWVITKEREKLISKAKKIPEIGKGSMSNILEDALREYVKKHGDSKNPQTEIPMWQNGNVLAVPNLYADQEDWIKFYNLIKRKEDYKELDVQINMILNLHNSNLKHF